LRGDFNFFFFVIACTHLCEPFTRYKKYDEKRQHMMKACLLKIQATPELAVDIYEVVTKSLK
jgi:hypothetical protein